MATYTEIRGLYNEDDFRNKVEVAVVIAAHNLINPPATPSANERAWAADVFANPRSEGDKALLSVLAENNGLDVSVILAASDSAIQTNVDAIVPALVDAKAGV